MAKPKFGKYSLVGEDDRLIDNAKLTRDSVNHLGILKIGTNFFLACVTGVSLLGVKSEQ